MGKRPNSRGTVGSSGSLHYFYVRVGEGKSASIRCEKARDPRQACKMAYGTIYDGPDDTARYKDIGTIKPANLSIKKKLELEGDDGWLPIPPANGERRRWAYSSSKKASEIKTGLYGFAETMDPDTIRFCYDLRLKQDPLKILVYEGVTYDRQSFGPIPDAKSGELEGHVWYTRRKEAITKQNTTTPSTTTTDSPLVKKLKENGATKLKGGATRKCGWKWVQDGGAFAILQIVNGEGGDYLFQRLTQEEFRLTKLEEDRVTSYTVSIGNVKKCGCEGFRHRQTCKHVDALVAMRKEGKL